LLNVQQGLLTDTHQSFGWSVDARDHDNTDISQMG